MSVKSDIEGVVRNLAQSFADGLTAGAVEIVDAPVGRHAVVACGKNYKGECKHTLCRSPWLSIVSRAEVFEDHPCPHAAYVWGAAVLATPLPSLRDKITGRYGNASYLGPEVGSGPLCAISAEGWVLENLLRFVDGSVWSVSCIVKYSHTFVGAHETHGYDAAPFGSTRKSVTA